MKQVLVEWDHPRTLCQGILDGITPLPSSDYVAQTKASSSLGFRAFWWKRPLILFSPPAFLQMSKQDQRCWMICLRSNSWWVATFRPCLKGHRHLEREPLHHAGILYSYMTMHHFLLVWAESQLDDQLETQEWYSFGEDCPSAHTRRAHCFIYDGESLCT